MTTPLKASASSSLYEIFSDFFFSENKRERWERKVEEAETSEQMSVCTSSKETVFVIYTQKGKLALPFIHAAT